MDKKTGGGPIHKERRQFITLPDGTKVETTALYAGEPNEEGWEHEGEEYKKEPARQCAAQENSKKICDVCDTTYSYTKDECPECGSSDHHQNRCVKCAEPKQVVCKGHGGALVHTKEHTDLAKRGSLKNGLSMAQIMLCPCIHKDNCEYANMLVDEKRYGSKVPRCLPEQEFHDAMVEYFNTEYDLDPVADQVMLNRLIMSMIRVNRGERIIAQYGEIVERTRTSADGSYESWWEQSAAAKTVESLDRRIQAWLRELQMSKAARNGNTLNINGRIDFATILSAPLKSEDVIIDAEIEDEGS